MKKAVKLIVFFMILFLFMLCITAKIYEISFGYRSNITEDETRKTLSNYPNLTREKEEILTKEKKKIIGYFYNKKDNQPLIIFSQGIGSRALDYIHEINYFVLKGYTVFSFDNIGCGESEGETIRGLSQSVVDLDCVLTHIENSEEFKKSKIFLYGHSWGGFAVCAVNNFSHKVAGVVERSGFNKSTKMIYKFLEENKNKVVAKIVSPFVGIYEFIKFGRYANITATDGINLASCPVMIMHSTDDTVVPYDVSIVSNKDKIKNRRLVIKEYSEKNHFITSDYNKIDYDILGEINDFFSLC